MFKLTNTNIKKFPEGLCKMYKFSAPMPYNKDEINELININNQIKKSGITSLYACVPRNCEIFTGFEQSRNLNSEYTDWNYWKNLIEHTLSKGCDFIYLLNSPQPLQLENDDFPLQLQKLDNLLCELKKIGVNKLRIASVQLMSYIAKHYNNFEILASTSLEYKTIWEYQNFIHFHPEIKQIVPSHDINRNFKLLSNLRKNYPDIEIELMVNEGCMKGCPHRIFHETVSIDKRIMINSDEILRNGAFATKFCERIIDEYPIHSLVMGNLIFPWDIKEYGKIGINNFKFVGRDGYIMNFTEKYINNFAAYLKGIDDIKQIENVTINDLTHHLIRNLILKNLKIGEYRKFLPKIKYFKKYGHLCASHCHEECRYCYKCAEKIHNRLRKKIKDIKRFSGSYVSSCKIDEN